MEAYAQVSLSATRVEAGAFPGGYLIEAVHTSKRLLTAYEMPQGDQELWKP